MENLNNIDYHYTNKHMPHFDVSRDHHLSHSQMPESYSKDLIWYNHLLQFRLFLPLVINECTNWL